MFEKTSQLSTAIADRYVIERELGAGGMATVYLAHDVKHDRKVALKVLRPELAAVIGAERFLQEIKVTANLQHPHILPLHDSGEAESFLYYVMPYVEGETLRERLGREKQLGIDDAIEITRSVAAALDYAHRHDVIHRDIKPENVLIHDGQAMVADFGIALAVSHAGGARLTETGLSIGTPHYMSPEQAMGDRELDARSDVYSLGAMLYEMLAGDPPYTGSTAQAIVAKVITERAQPVTAHRDTVPGHVAAAVEKALAKLPADRFHSAAEFAEALANPAFVGFAPGAAAAGAAAPLWNPLSRVTTAVALVLLAVTLWALLRPAAPGPVTRFAVALDEDEELYFTGQGNPSRLALSPDGSELVYVGVAGPQGRQLWHRPLDELHGRPLPGTEGAWAPVFSPDGERVAFVVFSGRGASARVVSLAGGPPITVVDSGLGSTVSWGPDDELYFLDGSRRRLLGTSAAGGPVEEVLTIDVPGTEYAWPHVLPGGNGVILTESVGSQMLARGSVDPRALELKVLDLQSGAVGTSVAGAFGAYAASGHLVYVTQEGTLMAASLDERSLELRGRPVALLEDVDIRVGGASDVTISANGSLAYTSQSFNAPEEVAWVTPQGEPRKVDPEWVRDWEFEGLALSPDGTRAAVVIEGLGEGRGDIWIKQLDRGPLSRLTFEGEYNSFPAWTADGRSLSYASFRQGAWDIWMKRADGSGPAELLLDLERDLSVTEWSRDGDWLVIAVSGPPGTDDIVAMRPGVDSVPVPVVADAFDEYEPALSPDARWLAYVSEESGRPEVYVRPFPNTGEGKWQVSTDGAAEPLWSRSGRELFFRSADGQSIQVADMSRGPSAAASRVFVNLPSYNDYERNQRNRLFDVAPDGRFVVIQRPGSPDVSGDLIIVQNWFAELKERTGE